MKRLFLYLLISTVVILPYGCGSKKTADGSAEKSKDEPKTVHVSVDSQKLIDLKIGQVLEAPFESPIEVLGEIAQETEKTFHITSPQPGTLKSFLKDAGEVVRKGEPLCEVKTKADQIIQVNAPDHGIVLARYVKEGDPIDSITSLMTLANTDVIRASFNVYEKDIAKVRVGQKVMIKSIAYPQKRFSGQVAFIAPNVDEKTRAIKVRVNINNEEDLLKFGMFVTGQIIELSEASMLLVPSEAIVTVDDSPAVFVPVGTEEFALRSVKIGKSGRLVEILEGLKKAENIVIRGSFQLKSELLKSTFGED